MTKLSESIGKFMGSLVGSFQKSRLETFTGQSLAHDPREIVTSVSEGERYHTTSVSGPATQLRAMQNSWFFSALVEITSEAASTPLRIVEQARINDKPIDVDNHPFEEIFKSPNPHMDGNFLMRYTTTWSKLDGNAYWFLAPDQNGNLSEIWPLPSDAVIPVPGDRNTGNFVDYYEYQSLGKIFRIDPYYIAHFQNIPNPWNLFDGLSELFAGALPIDSDTAMLRWQAKFFSKDNVMPSSIINMRSGNPARRVNPADVAALRSDLESNYEASKRKTLITTAPGGVDVSLLGWNPRDMDFVLGRKQTKEEIWNLLGLPTGVYESNTTEASAKVSVRILKDTVWKRTLVPFAEQITIKIIWKFYGREFRATFDDIRPVDRELVLKENADKREIQSFDEARKTQGLKEYTGPYQELISGLPWRLATNPQFVAEVIKIERGIYDKPKEGEKSTPPLRSNSKITKAIELETKGGGMIAIMLPGAITKKMYLPPEAYPDGAEVVPLSERHITLKFLPEYAFIKPEVIRDALAEFAEQEPMFKITINGEDRFYRPDKQRDVIIYNVTSPALLGFRERLNAFLVGKGIDIPDEFPTYTPHVTIAYIDSLDALSVSPEPIGDVWVTEVSLVFNGQVHTYNLLGEDALKHLSLWREKAVRQGGAVEFKSDFIPKRLYTKIHSGLLNLTEPTPAEIKAVFTI